MQCKKGAYRVFPTHVGVFLKPKGKTDNGGRLPHARGGVSNGEPFATEAAAKRSLPYKRMTNPEIVAVEGGFGIRIETQALQDQKGADVVADVREMADGKRYYDHSFERKTGAESATPSNAWNSTPVETDNTASNQNIASETDDSSYIRFSIRQPEAYSVTHLSREDLSNTIRTILIGFKDGDNRATIVDTFDGLPDKIKQDTKNQGSDGQNIEGVFHNGTIYVIADKITSREMLETLLFHEGTHGGVNALYAMPMRA